MGDTRRKKVNVTYISDSDVANIFVSLDGEGLYDSQKGRVKRKADTLKCEQEDIELPDLAVQSKPSNLFESGDVTGQQIFGFCTPKRHGALASRALDSGSKTPKTPQRIKTPMQVTPSSRRGKPPKTCTGASPLSHKLLDLKASPRQSLSQKVSRQVNETPKAVKKLQYLSDEVRGKDNALCPQTPYNLRRRFKKKIAIAASEEQYSSDEREAEDFSGDESDWASKSEDSLTNSSSEDEECDGVQNVILTKKGAGFGPSNCKNFKLNFMPATEQYFQSHASRKIHTSNRTLGKLRHNLPQEKLQKLLSETTSSHTKHLEKLQNNAIFLFSKWQFMLSSRLFLVIHNIDGVMLRNDKCQEVLASLSSTPNIHLIASIDHISAPLMWDQNVLSLFNFSWWDTTTFQPYVNETAFESSLLVQQSGHLALSSLQNVFRSLTNNAKKIFLLMAEYQKEHKDESHYSGMPFKKLYTMCRESLLVSSDLALRSQLTEFLDHRLVKSRRGHDGSELLSIPIDMSILDQFINQQEFFIFTIKIIGINNL
ncbi:GH22255, partial [Gryllus bimaculatus]